MLLCLLIAEFVIHNCYGICIRVYHHTVRSEHLFLWLSAGVLINIHYAPLCQNTLSAVKPLLSLRVSNICGETAFHLVILLLVYVPFVEHILKYAVKVCDGDHTLHYAVHAATRLYFRSYNV